MSGRADPGPLFSFLSLTPASEVSARDPGRPSPSPPRQQRRTSASLPERHRPTRTPQEHPRPPRRPQVRPKQPSSSALVLTPHRWSHCPPPTVAWSARQACQSARHCRARSRSSTTICRACSAIPRTSACGSPRAGTVVALRSPTGTATGRCRPVRRSAAPAEPVRCGCGRARGAQPLGWPDLTRYLKVAGTSSRGRLCRSVRQKDLRSPRQKRAFARRDVTGSRS